MVFFEVRFRCEVERLEVPRLFADLELSLRAFFLSALLASLRFEAFDLDPLLCAPLAPDDPRSLRLCFLFLGIRTLSLVRLRLLERRRREVDFFSLRELDLLLRETDFCFFVELLRRFDSVCLVLLPPPLRRLRSDFCFGPVDSLRLLFDAFLPFSPRALDLFLLTVLFSLSASLGSDPFFVPVLVFALFVLFESPGALASELSPGVVELSPALPCSPAPSDPSAPSVADESLPDFDSRCFVFTELPESWFFPAGFLFTPSLEVESRRDLDRLFLRFLESFLFPEDLRRPFPVFFESLPLRDFLDLERVPFVDLLLLRDEPRSDFLRDDDLVARVFFVFLFFVGLVLGIVFPISSVVLL